MAKDESSPQQQLGDLVKLTKSYAIQETIDPLKGLGKFILYGLAAATIGGIAVIMILLGVLRFFQTETDVHLADHLSWVPYLVTLVVAAILVGLSVRAIANKKERSA